MPRPRKPTAMKELEGNPGDRPLPENEPKPRAVVPVAPDWLDGDAVDLWNFLVPELDLMGVLTIVDGQSLAAACTAWSEFKAATITLQAEGRVIEAWTQKKETDKETGNVTVTWIKVKGSRIPHPAVQQQRSAWEAWRKYSALFGLDPSSRSRINVKPGGEVDPLDEFTKPRIAQETA